MYMYKLPEFRHSSVLEERYPGAEQTEWQREMDAPCLETLTLLK